MKLLDLKTWRRKKKNKGYYGPMQKEKRQNGKAPDATNIRRFDAATTNRLNRSQWSTTTGNSINVDLQDLPTLMARCAYQAANNPIVNGALETLETDIVGRNGPRLQVVSDDDSFNDAVEHAWRTVWNMPDPNGQLAGPENMRLWVRMLNTAGSFLNVFANVDRGNNVSFGWRTIHPRRLHTPAALLTTSMSAFGIEFDEFGKPLRYNITKTGHGVGLASVSLDTTAFDASIVQHRFFADEPEQITGYPALTPCLEVVADLQEFDKLVLEAAKNSAAHTPYLEAWSPESVLDPEPLPPGGYDVEAGQANAAPLGWRWNSVASTNPNAQYTEFRHERLRDLGNALGMPLMMVLLSSANSNFASAHYDGAVYLRRLRTMQSWLERRTLNELLEQVILELIISSEVERPERYSFRWTWETPPYVNPEKQRRADRMAVEDGAMPLDEYSASLGLDWDEVVEARKRIAEQLVKAGLPAVPVNYGSGNQDTSEASKETWTVNEKRIEDGLEPIPGGDAIMASSSDIPAFEFEQEQP